MTDTKKRKRKSSLVVHSGPFSRVKVCPPFVPAPKTVPLTAYFVVFDLGDTNDGDNGGDGGNNGQVSVQSALLPKYISDVVGAIEASLNSKLCL